MKYQTVPQDETTSTPSSRVHRHRDGSVIGLAIFVLVASLAVWNIAEPRKEAGRNNIRANDNLPRVRPTSPPKFLFGFSTGHAGSTSIHNEMKGFFHNNCAKRDISVVAHFENVAPGELGMKYDPETPSCNKTKEIVLPYLYEKFIFEKMGNRSESGWIYIDIGHFHNGLSHLECFADLLKSDVGFVHIRRDRYQIANSFAREFQTPCHRAADVQIRDNGKRLHPRLSYCPHSMEMNGPVALPSPSDQIWMSLNPFQKFLWLADDIEMRWHELTQTYKGVKEAPQFYEVTWSNPEELKTSLFQVFEEMPCSGDKFKQKQSVTQAKTHVKHSKASVNCTQRIAFDMEYRSKLSFTKDQASVLFGQKRQPLVECMESRITLEEYLKSFPGNQLNYFRLPDVDP